MKNLKYFIAIFMISLAFNVSAQKTLIGVDGEPVKTKLTSQQVDYVKSEFRKGMDSFVGSVRPFYKAGMSFNQFEIALIGSSNKTMPSEGKNLLLKAFKYLSNSTASRTILSKDSGKEIAAALIFVKKSEYKNKGTDANYTLFGVDQGAKLPINDSTTASRKCKWYQIGCHLSNVWDWLNANHTNLLAVITTISTIISQIF